MSDIKNDITPTRPVSKPTADTRPEIYESLPHPVSALRTNEYKNNAQNRTESSIMQSLNNNQVRQGIKESGPLSPQPKINSGDLLRKEFGDTPTISETCSAQYNRLRRNVGNKSVSIQISQEGHDKFQKACAPLIEMGGRYMNTAIDLIKDPRLVLSRHEGESRLEKIYKEVEDPTLKKTIKDYVNNRDYNSPERINLAHDLVKYSEDHFISGMEKARKDLNFLRHVKSKERINLSTTVRERMNELYQYEKNPNEYKLPLHLERNFGIDALPLTFATENLKNKVRSTTDNAIGIQPNGGLIVREVKPNSIAASLNVKQDDIIVAFTENEDVPQSITSMDSLREHFKRAEGKNFSLFVYRNGVVHRLDVTPVELENERKRFFN